MVIAEKPRSTLRPVLPDFMRGDRGKGLEQLDAEDYSWDLEETREQLDRFLSAAVRKQSAKDRVSIAVSAAPYRTAMGRKPTDDMELLLQAAEAKLADLDRKVTKKRSVYRLIREVAQARPDWERLSVTSQESIERRLRIKFLDHQAPLLEVSRRRRDAQNGERNGSLVSSRRGT